MPFWHVRKFSPDLAIQYLFFAQIAFWKQSCQIFQVILKFLQYNAGSEAEHRFRIDFNPHFPISISLFPNVLISDAHTDCPGSPIFFAFRMYLRWIDHAALLRQVKQLEQLGSLWISPQYI